MFGWLRRWWYNEQVPEKPLQSDLDWPDEEEWYFDYDAWKWKARVRVCSPYAVCDDDEDDEIPVLEVVEDDTHFQCCGGQCKPLPPPLPPPDDPVWRHGPVDVAAPGTTAVCETEAPPVVGVVQTEHTPSATSPPVNVGA